MPETAATPATDRLLAIAHARRAWLEGEAGHGGALVEPWLQRSWQRCLAAGRRPGEAVVFEPVSRQGSRRALDASHALVEAARPVIERVSRAIADTRYFAILTDAAGIVVHVGALPDGSDASALHARSIARVGVDLSERAVGTTAIGAVLAERDSVWLHRGEHFFDDTSIYSCAGAPLFGPTGECIGMLDLTGVQATERPELRHLAALSARSIEDALMAALPCELLLRIGWPGDPAAAGAEGLLAIDAEGCISGANRAARQMLNRPLDAFASLHCSELFAIQPQMLFDAARQERADGWLELPLWSGLRVQVRPELGRSVRKTRLPSSDAVERPRLRDLEAELIRRAVDEARGNVAEAARTLGISRATVYRKLVRSKRKPG
ncbi:Regulatory protein, Fis family [Burkholderiales bacterium 8X]|nr:Regulatory protein, Fis family [Burkholderiales bacterium 8X]